MSKDSPARNRSGESPIRTLLASHRRELLASWQRLAKAPLATLMTVTVIAVALLLPACLALVNTNLQTVVDEFRGSARITLYLHAQTAAEQAAIVSANLLERPDIQESVFVSREDALQDFSAAAGLGEVLAALPENPLPAAIVVTPVPATPDAIAALAADLRQLPEVETAQLDEVWIRRIDALASTVGLLARSLALLIGIGVCFIVGNTIRSTVESRRDEIRVIKLVGGSDSYIARPLLYAGFLQGAAGGVMAAALLLLLSWSAGTALRDLASPDAMGWLELRGPGLMAIMALVAGGALLGWLAALGASWRYIRAVAP